MLCRTVELRMMCVLFALDLVGYIALSQVLRLTKMINHCLQACTAAYPASPLVEYLSFAAHSGIVVSSVTQWFGVV